MKLDRIGLVAVGSMFAWACSSSSSPPQPPDEAGLDGETTGTDGGPSDATGPDARGTLDGPSGDGADATVTSLDCPPEKVATWDHYVPDGSDCNSFSLESDSDGDGVPDCLDGCPTDGHKTAPGACGCGISDIDTDGDGIADCNDKCPLDPNNVDVGQCGCVGSVITPQPAGTACTDPTCPQPGATCNATAVCGDRSTCAPCPGGHYLLDENEVGFWFCGGELPAVEGPGCFETDGSSGVGATRAAAESACAAKGLTLANIESLTENRFLAQFMTTPMWIGANDLQTPGDWYWSSATTDSGTLFWTGSADGASQPGDFSNWTTGAPGSASCASMTPDGLWSDTDCAQSLGYICVYRIY